MGVKITSALSPEMRGLFKEDEQDFNSVFDSVVQQTRKINSPDPESKDAEAGAEAKPDLRDKDAKPKPNLILSRGVEAKTEVEHLADGKIAVTVVLPIIVRPTNDGAKNAGRIDVRDTFVFDAKQQKYQDHSYQRHFKYNGRGDNKEEWKQWLAKCEHAPLPSEQDIKHFAEDIALSYSRPFRAEFLPKFSKHQGDFFGDLFSTEGLQRMMQDPRSHYAVINRGLIKELIFTYVVVDLSGKKPGSLVVQDKFVLQGNSNAVIGFDRRVKPGVESKGDPEWQGKADRLSQAGKPNLETAEAFAKEFMPDILTSQPDFEAAAKAEFPPPPGGYPEYSEAMFKKTMASLARKEQAVPLADFDAGFYQGLSRSKDYFAPLQAALGENFSLNLKDPPLEVSTQIDGDKTLVFFKYSLRPDPEKSSDIGCIDYTERWTFDKTGLTKITRRALTYGAEDGSIVDRAGKKLSDSIENGEFPTEKDNRARAMGAAVLRYVAPNIYPALRLPRILDRQDLSFDQKLHLTPLDQALNFLTPLLFQAGVDFKFRSRVFRILGGLLYDDPRINLGAQDASAAIIELTQDEGAALQAAKTLEDKQLHEDRLRMAKVVFAIYSGDLSQARDLVNGFHSPLFKKAFKDPLAVSVAQQQSLEGLGIMMKVAEDQINLRVHESKAWFGGGPEVDKDIEKKILDGLFAKAFRQVEVTKSADPMAVLRDLRDLREVNQGKTKDLNNDESDRYLTPEEQTLAGRILDDRIMQSLASAAQEDAKDSQANAYFQIARSDLFQKGLVGSAAWLTQKVAIDMMPKSRAGEGLDFLKQLASEQIEISYAPKLQESPNAGGMKLISKLVQKLRADPQPPLIDQLNALDPLSDDEKKIRDQWVNNPVLQKLSGASTLDLKDRVQAYKAQFEALKLPQEWKTDKLKTEAKELQAQLSEIFTGLEQPQLKVPVVVENLQALQLFMQFQLFGEKADAATIKARFTTLNELVKKASALAQDKNVSAFDILKLPKYSDKDSGKDSAKASDLTLEEKELRDWIFNDEVLKRVSAIAALKPTQKRIEAYQALFAGYQIPKDVAKPYKDQLGSLNFEQPQYPGVEAAALLPLLIQMQNLKVLNELQGKQKVVQDLLEKATWMAPRYSDETAFAVLKRLKDADLSDDEKKARDALLNDDNFKKFTEIVAEPDIEKRSKAYVTLLNDGTMEKTGYAQSQDWLRKVLGNMGISPELTNQQFSELITQQKLEQANQQKQEHEIREFLALPEGEAHFSTKFEYGLPHFAKEVTKPTMLAAMFLAPIAGAYSEALGIGLGRSGLVAAGMGVGGEAAAFTYGSKFLDSAFYSSEGQWDHHGKDFLTNALSFGAMRAAHFGKAVFTERVLATGKLGFNFKWATGKWAWVSGKWAGRYVAGEAAETALAKTPLAKIEMFPSAPGPGVPQLTVNGARVAALLDHGVPLLAMHAANRFSHWVGLNPQKAGFDDTLMMYLQSIISYQTVDFVSNGAVARIPANLRSRMENLKIQDFILADHSDKQVLQWRSLKPGAKQSIDGFLLGQEDGNDVHIRKNRVGEIELVDGRKPDDASGETPEPILRNGHAVPFGKAVKLSDGDVLSFDGKMFPVTLPKAPRTVVRKLPKGMIHLFDGELNTVVLTDANGAKFEWKSPKPKSNAKAKIETKPVEEENAQASDFDEEAPTTEITPVDEQQDGDTQTAVPAPVAETSLDPFLLGREGNEIRVLKYADGKLMLLDGQKAAGSTAGADSGNTPPNQKLFLNGKEVKPGEPTGIRDGDVLMQNGRDVRITLPESNPLARELAQAPREQQLSLANMIERAKNPEALLKALRNSYFHGVGEVAQAMSEVFEGRRPLQTLPTELNLQAKVQGMLEAQVAELNKAGFEMKPGYVLRPELLDPRMTQLEIDFQTLKAMEMLKAQVGASRGFAELLPALGRARLKTIGGVKVEEIFDWLGREQLQVARAKVEEFNERLMKKIKLATERIGETEAKEKSSWRKLMDRFGKYFKEDNEVQGSKVLKLINRLSNWSGALSIFTLMFGVKLSGVLGLVFAVHKFLIRPLVRLARPSPTPELAEVKEKSDQKPDQKPDQNKEKLEKWTEELAGNKVFLAMLDHHLKMVGKDAKDHDKLIDQLPPDLRQKFRDAEEQAAGKGGVTVKISQEEKLLPVVKKYLGAQIEDFDTAQNTLRQALDSADSHARLLLRRATPEELDLIMKAYFGSADSRELPSAQGFQLMALLGGAKLNDAVGLAISTEHADGMVKIVRGDLDAVARAQDGDALVVRTHSARADGRQLVFPPDELSALAEQALNLWKREDVSGPAGQPFRAVTPAKFHGQNSDTQLFYDPKTRSFQTWEFYPQAVAKIRITMSKAGEIKSFEVKYAVKPGAPLEAGLATPPKTKEILGNKGIEVRGQAVDYATLLQEFPVDIQGVTRVERFSDGVARVRARVPKLRRGEKKTEAPSTAKDGDAKDDAAKKGPNPPLPVSDDKAAIPDGREVGIDEGDLMDDDADTSDTAQGGSHPPSPAPDNEPTFTGAEDTDPNGTAIEMEPGDSNKPTGAPAGNAARPDKVDSDKPAVPATVAATSQGIWTLIRALRMSGETPPDKSKSEIGINPDDIEIEFDNIPETAQVSSNPAHPVPAQDEAEIKEINPDDIELDDTP